MFSLILAAALALHPDSIDISGRLARDFDSNGIRVGYKINVPLDPDRSMVYRLDPATREIERWLGDGAAHGARVRLHGRPGQLDYFVVESAEEID